MILLRLPLKTQIGTQLKDIQYQKRLKFCTCVNNIQSLCKYLNISESECKSIQVNYPKIKKLDDDTISKVVKVISELGFSKNVLLDYPTLLYIKPSTIKLRYNVLQECGITHITTKQIAFFSDTMRRKTVRQLKMSGIIEPLLNVEDKLVNCLSQWPTSHNLNLAYDHSVYTLYELRVLIILRYFELMLHFSTDECKELLKTFRSIKFRPLQVLEETLLLLQQESLMPNEEIKSNFCLLCALPNNLRQILSNFEDINIKHHLRIYPHLANKDCSAMIETRNVLNEFNISLEAQQKNINIYFLKLSTLKYRLQKITEIPEFKLLRNHPRFLQLILCYNKTIKRIKQLKKMNKKSFSIKHFIDDEDCYKEVLEAEEDSIVSKQDLAFCIKEIFGSSYSGRDLSKALARFPFWLNVPVLQIQCVYDQLRANYSVKDIYENCQILLYPWNKIKDVMDLLHGFSQQSFHNILGQININSLSKSQELSLILYLLEKRQF